MLSFDTHNGYFIEPKNHRVITETLGELLEARECGRVSETRYISGLKALAEQHPNYLDAHAHLGYALLGSGRTKAALEASERGMAIADSLVPPGYAGLIEWGWLENRPFLRTTHATVLSLLASKRRGRAIELMERLLRWNPDDNQGIRLVIGSELLRDGRIEPARTWLEKCAEEYPPYRYELGLLHFREKAYAEAATSFRKGFLENGYIAEIITGTPMPLPLAIWHGSNFAEPDLAREYMNHQGDLWNKTPKAIAFLRWLHMHPMALHERAEAIALQQSLLWEDDYRARSALLDQLSKVSTSIGHVSSKDLVDPVASDGKRTVYPWMAGEARMIRAEKARVR